MPRAEKLGREFGVRSMAIFQGKSDPKPCLYAGVMSLWGGLILRSEDGRTFEPVAENGIDDDTALSFRGLTGLNGWLFTSPAGTVNEAGSDLNIAPSASIYCTDDPLKGNWQLAAEPSFGDPGNGSIFSLVTAHGYVYAGSANPVRGFQLWRTKAEGKPPFNWERVLTDGGWRYNHNFSTSAMAEFNGALYVGSGVPGLGYDRTNDIGPAAGELLRVWPDGSWDLIFGELRATPDGLKVPLSGSRAGAKRPLQLCRLGDDCPSRPALLRHPQLGAFRLGAQRKGRTPARWLPAVVKPGWRAMDHGNRGLDMAR